MSLPTGTIILWSGSIVSIPTGWILCNGAGGSPDLRNNFIVGAGDTYAVDAAGGTLQHRHAFVTDGHVHTLVAGANIAAGANYDDDVSSETDNGLTSYTNHLPPYHALAYIMKT